MVCPGAERRPWSPRHFRKRSRGEERIERKDEASAGYFEHSVKTPTVEDFEGIVASSGMPHGLLWGIECRKPWPGMVEGDANPFNTTHYNTKWA